MSSHHIIREDQEPALLIMDTTTVPFELVQELLEWSPTVMVGEQALPEVMSWGIKIDVVIAYVDHVPALTTLLRDQFPLKLISYHDQEEALLTALYFLISTKQKAVNVVATQLLESFESFSSLDISVFQSGKRWSFIRQGVFEKWLPVGTTLELFPPGDEPLIKMQQDGIQRVIRQSGFWLSEIN